MRMLSRRGVLALLVLGLACATAGAQVAKKGGRTAASPTYRTLMGKVMDVKAADQMLTVNVASTTGKAAKGGQEWVLSVGKQTLLMRAGKNGQYSMVEFGDVQKGETVQAVVELQADPTDKSHATWWLVAYPTGTMPPER
jgi:hypothetical protein